MEWVAVKELPKGYRKYINTDIVDGNIKSVTIKLPNEAPLKIVMPTNYSDTLRLVQPKEPEKVLQYIVMKDGKRTVFDDEQLAKKFAEEIYAEVSKEEVLKTDDKVQSGYDDDDVVQF